MGVDINDSKFGLAEKMGADECMNSLQVPNKDIKVRGKNVICFFLLWGIDRFPNIFGVKNSVHICGHSSEGTWLSGSPRNSSLVDADC